MNDAIQLDRRYGGALLRPAGVKPELKPAVYHESPKPMPVVSPMPVAAPKPIERRPLGSIVAMICRKHGITEAMMRGPSKNQRIALARSEYAIVTQACGYSFPEAAREIDKDHSTLVLAAQRWRTRQGVVTQ